jgi:hypothetical protein
MICFSVCFKPIKNLFLSKLYRLFIIIQCFSIFWTTKTYYISNRFIYHNIIKLLKNINNLIKEFKHKDIFYANVYIINISKI